MGSVKRTLLGLGLATVSALSACGPLAPFQDARSVTSRVAGAKPAKAADSLKTTKEPVGLVRQAAFVKSLHDILPVTLASGGMGTLNKASSLVSNNGGGLISNNGGSLISDNGLGLIANNSGSLIAGAGGAWRLLQMPLSLLPEYTRVRQDVVLHQRPVGLMSAVLSLYDPKAWDPKPGADNEGALIDRFGMEVIDFKLPAADEVAFDLDLKVITSRRIPFVDKLVLRQKVKKSATTGKLQSTRMEYLMGFDVKLADGVVDRAALTFVAEAQDLTPALDQDGDATVSFEPRRMTLTGTNGHGAYTGEAEFPPGGAILGRFTHTRPDGAEATGEFALQPDGSSTQLATSRQGRLALAVERTADGKPTLEVRDLAGAASATRPNAAAVEGGVATLDLGEPTKSRARIF